MKEKRIGVGICILLLVVGLFIFASFVFAEEGDSEGDADAQDGGEDVPEELIKQNKAFDCLVKELKPDCSGATNIQQLSFSILASPNITGVCVNRLNSLKKSSGCFGEGTSCGIKETALAILALNHVGLDTKDSEKWLMAQNKSSSDVKWFLQQNSDEESECKITYGGNDYTFYARENKKLESSNLGSCFRLTNSNYWLELQPSCFDEVFVLRCNKRFSASWHYESPGSSVMNILSDSKDAAPNDEVRLAVNSKCLGLGTGCDFEGTAWGAIALKRTFNDISSFVPYLVSAEDSNRPYFPAALNYLVLESPIYSNKIAQQQIDGQYWRADGSNYGEHYDTSLALLSIGIQNDPRIDEAKKWVWNFKQQDDGCWNSKNVRDTAFLLWAVLLKQAPSIDPSVSQTTLCEEGLSGFTCSGSFVCTEAGGKVETNYWCGGSEVCCSINPRKSCEELQGTICPSGKVCSEASFALSSDDRCCLTECVDPPESTTTQCAEFGGICRNSCFRGEELVNYDCSGTQICCKSESKSDRGIPLWVWLLIGILIILIVLAIVFRDRLKAYYYKFKNRNKGPGQGSPAQRPPFGPGGPPRPGFPPLRRPMGRPMSPRGPPMARPPIQQGQKPQDAFAKLKEMSK
jgi:hypothetical protein